MVEFLGELSFLKLSRMFSMPVSCSGVNMGETAVPGHCQMSHCISDTKPSVLGKEVPFRDQGPPRMSLHGIR